MRTLCTNCNLFSLWCLLHFIDICIAYLCIVFTIAQIASHFLQLAHFSALSVHCTHTHTHAELGKTERRRECSLFDFQHMMFLFIIRKWTLFRLVTIHCKQKLWHGCACKRTFFMFSLFLLLFIHFITILFNEVVSMSLFLMPRRCTLNIIWTPFSKNTSFGIHNGLRRNFLERLFGIWKERRFWPCNETTWSSFYQMSPKRARIFGALMSLCCLKNVLFRLSPFEWIM